MANDVKTPNLSRLAYQIGRSAELKSAKLAVAESCTGGQICHEITNVPGSSAYLVGGVVAYDNRVKVNLLKVPGGVIEEYGAVSAPCVEYMAAGTAELFGCGYGIAVSGIAGPGGGSAQKPVGTVFIAVKTPQAVQVYHHVFTGSRRQVKKQAACAALKHLLEALGG